MAVTHSEKEQSHEFPKGQRSDKFLISTPDGPAYIITRGDLEDITKNHHMPELKQAIAIFTSRGSNSRGPLLDVDAIIGIRESAIIWPLNR